MPKMLPVYCDFLEEKNKRTPYCIKQIVQELDITVMHEDQVL